MNCKRAEQLMPLDAGGDLADARERAALAAHLSDCAACRRVSEEWAESRNLLRLHEPPDFGAAFFDQIRRDVMREITAQTASSAPSVFTAPAPSVFDGLLARLLRPRALAYAASLALVFAALLFAFSLSRAPQPSKVLGEGVAASVNETLSNEFDATKQTPRFVAQEQAPRKTRVGRTVPLRDRRDRRAPTHAAAPLPDNAVSTPRPNANAELAVVRDEREMLKIEWQTSDPDVRIIWFSPQPGAQTSPRRSNDQR